MRPSPQTVLVLTSAEDVTANIVIEALNERRVHVARVDPADIGAGLTFGASIGNDHTGWAGRLRTASRDIALEQVGAVYYRRPNLYSDRFAHLPTPAGKFGTVEARYGLGGILRSLHGATYVSHPAALHAATYKPAQLLAAAQLGLSIPPTLITNDIERARAFAAEHGPIIYKSFRGAPPSVEGCAAIWTQRVTADDLDDSLSVTAHLFQQEVNKASDARVTVIGRKVFATRISSADGVLDWRSADGDNLVHELIDVPEPIQGALHAYLDRFGLAFGAFDFAIEADTGRWVFIECNPNGQWAWLPDADAMAQALADLLLKGWWS